MTQVGHSGDSGGAQVAQGLVSGSGVPAAALLHSVPIGHAKSTVASTSAPNLSRSAARTGVHAIDGCQQAQQGRQAVWLGRRRRRLRGIHCHEGASSSAASWAGCLGGQLLLPLLHAQLAQRVGGSPVDAEGHGREWARAWVGREGGTVAWHRRQGAGRHLRGPSAC